MNDIKQEARSKAEEIREQYDLGNEPISDIFNFIESLNILLAQKPLDRDEGISAFYIGHNETCLFFINSSQSLGRQYFSAAHEIYHYFYDDNTSRVCNPFKFKKQTSVTEKSADYFAVHFLMPEEGVRKYLERLSEENVNIKNVIKAQKHFKVSYKAMLVRLKVLDYISSRQYENMMDTHLRSTFAKLGYDPTLIKPTNETKIPQKYMELLHENYEENQITPTAYKKYLHDVGLTPNALEKEEVIESVEESSFDY